MKRRVRRASFSKTALKAVIAGIVVVGIVYGFVQWFGHTYAR
jgi:hypothetical protein